MTGKVYIVGGGPGDPELITLKALKALSKADVVIYDALVPKELLRFVKKNAKLIFAGKKPRRHTYTQEEINRILYNYALQGKVVVRLKGGDPYVFGRGEEEAEYLAEKGVECEVIPGVTSAVAVPAYAGIPVTSRKVASSVAIVTGREAEEKRVKRVKLDEIAKCVDTIVILMGVGTLKESIESIRRSLPGDTPVAVISKGAMPEQKVVVGTLKDIVEKARKARVEPPAVIVVGEVVRFRSRIWRYK